MHLPVDGERLGRPRHPDLDVQGILPGSIGHGFDMDALDHISANNLDRDILGKFGYAVEIEYVATVAGARFRRTRFLAADGVRARRRASEMPNNP